MFFGRPSFLNQQELEISYGIRVESGFYMDALRRFNLLLEENSDFPYFESDGPLCAMNS